jgi:hypothetical protein
MLRRFLKIRGVQLTAFIGSFAIGAAGVLSGGWMVVHGDLSFAMGMISSALPLAIGCIGLHKLSKAGRPISAS